MNISVVVPFYNTGKYIEKCIQSLLDQDYPDSCYEILMVDNNSTDGAAAIVKEYPRIRLLKELRQSAYAARNRGIRNAMGEIIAFTDSDCQADPRWLSSIERSMRDSNRGIVLGIREYTVPSSGLRLLSGYESSMAAYVFTSNRKETFFGYTNNMAVRRSLFKQLNDFRVLNRGADTVFVRKAVEAYGCGIVAFNPDMRVRHLEISSTLAFCKKRLVYGKSTERNRRLGSARPLSQKERIVVFLNTIRIRRFTLWETLLLFALLNIGLLFYEVGRWRGK